MKLSRFALVALALSLATPVFLTAQYGPPPPPPGGGPPPPPPGGGWDAPPPEFRDVQRQGFHDGIEAARNDFDRRRQPNAGRRREFRRPPVPPPVRDAYRDGFRRGYDSAFSHFRGGPYYR
jgi:hypothetical protein